MSNEAVVYDAAMSEYDIELEDAQSDWSRARRTGDLDGLTEASRRMARIRNEAREYHQMSVEHARSMRPQPRYLPSKEVVAHMDVNELIASGIGPELLRAHGYFGDISDQDFAAGKAWAAATRSQYGR